MQWLAVCVNNFFKSAILRISVATTIVFTLTKLVIIADEFQNLHQSRLVLTLRPSPATCTTSLPASSVVYTHCHCLLVSPGMKAKM